jgi:hypothetical protein
VLCPLCNINELYIDIRNSSRSTLIKANRDLELRDYGRSFPLGWDKTIGWMDSRVKK